MKHSPNFLTCPAAAQLPPPREPDFESKTEALPKIQPLANKDSNPFVALRPADEPPASPPSNLPSSTPAPVPAKPLKKSFFKTGIILAVVLVIILLLAPPVYALAKASWAGYQAKIALNNMQVMLEAGEFESAKQEASIAAEQFGIMQKYLKSIGLWRDMPYVGTQIRGLETVAQVSAQSLDGVEDILQVAVAMQQALFAASKASGQSQVDIDAHRSLQDLSAEERRALLGSLYKSLPDIRLARDKMDIALSLWEDVPKEQMAAPIRNALAPLVEFLPIMQQSLEQSVPLIEVFIPLLGYPNPQSYVIITQNADEMRPAGGFIGSVIATEIDAGNINTFDFFDVYNIDNPASGVWDEVPPAPIQQHLGVTKWFMRDANWSPDFPTSAERVLDFYERERAIAVGSSWPRQDGLVALEPGFFNALLAFTGPVVVRGKTFDASNFMDVLQYEVEMAPGITVLGRKDLMGEVAEAIIAKIQAMPRSDWPKLINIITTALNQKQVLIYNRDPSIQSFVDNRNWSARTKPTIGDFVWIIDANLAALKTDGVMSKSAEYTLDVRDIEKPRANLTLTYTNTNPQITWRYTRYRSYTRVYVPEGSRLISSSGAMAGDLVQTRGRFVPGQVDVMKELGKTVFGAFWSVEPGKTGKLSFTYELPPESVASILDGTYRLDWPKQPGVDNAEFNVKILFPQSVASAQPPEPKEKWGDTIYEAQAGSLYDQVFIVELE